MAEDKEEKSREEEKSEDKGIPTTKVQRAMRVAKSGARVGKNYLSHFAKNAFNKDVDRTDLDTANAKELFASLGQLKGGALKLAQMISIDKNVLPEPYAKQLEMAQNKAPSLSYPLVVKIFRNEFGKEPTDIFDEFSKEAINAASIGQVHKAKLDGKDLAVKVQYPGIADSIKSDIQLIKPLARRFLRVSEVELKEYVDEVQDRLLEETEYKLELKRSIELTEACNELGGIYFPEYYEELSGDRILTMSWIDGKGLNDFMETNPSQEIKNKIGQKIWDYYDHQIHKVKKVQADPHPGNFLVKENGDIGIIDFGCVKEIPESFYKRYFRLLNSEIYEGDEYLKLFKELDMILDDDNEEQQEFFAKTFKRSILLLARPFHNDEFDFGDQEYFDEIYEYGEEATKSAQLQKAKAARGPSHSLYLNRTYFGLYNILHKLEAKVKTSSHCPYV